MHVFTWDKKLVTILILCPCLYISSQVFQVHFFANRQIKPLRFLGPSYPELRLKALSKGLLFV